MNQSKIQKHHSILTPNEVSKEFQPTPEYTNYITLCQAEPYKVEDKIGEPLMSDADQEQEEQLRGPRLELLLPKKLA